MKTRDMKTRMKLSELCCAVVLLQVFAFLFMASGAAKAQLVSDGSTTTGATDTTDTTTADTTDTTAATDLDMDLYAVGKKKKNKNAVAECIVEMVRTNPDGSISSRVFWNRGDRTKPECALLCTQDNFYGDCVGCTWGGGSCY